MSISKLHEHVLDLGIKGECMHPELAPYPRFLVAAERSVGAVTAPPPLRVDGHPPTAQGPRDPQRAADFARPHRAIEAVVAVVGKRDCLILALEGNDDHDRAENLLARNAHAVIDMRHDRWREIASIRPLPRTVAATEDAYPFGNSCIDQALDVLPMGLSHQRPHLGLRIEGIADAESFGGCDKCRDKLVV